jgi:hypothetical protein
VLATGVAAEATGAPQAEQKAIPSGTDAPHFVQKAAMVLSLSYCFECADEE